MTKASRTARTRYTGIAIILHWVIAIAIFALIGFGLWMTDAIHAPETKAQAFVVYQWHKSLGLTVLALVFLRLIWRLFYPPPPLPHSMPAWEKLAASISHRLFYVLMIAMPLLGWAMVSASPFGLPTMYFGLFEWPHIVWLVDIEDKKPVEAIFKSAHRAGAYLLMALIGLHIAAALKHWIVDRDEIIGRMLPFLRKDTP